MPVMDGFETMKRLTEQRSDSGRPFIIGCSANGDADTMAEVMSAGAHAFLTKPFTLKQFQSCLHTKNSLTAK